MTEVGAVHASKIACGTQATAIVLSDGIGQCNKAAVVNPVSEYYKMGIAQLQQF